MHLFNFIAHFDINNENTNKYRGLDDTFEHDWASGFYWVRKKMNIFNMFVLDCNSCKPMDLLLILHSENKSWKIYFIVDGFEYSNFEYNYNIYWLKTWKNGQFLNIYGFYCPHKSAIWHLVWQYKNGRDRSHMRNWQNFNVVGGFKNKKKKYSKIDWTDLFFCMF